MSVQALQVTGALAVLLSFLVLGCGTEAQEASRDAANSKTRLESAQLDNELHFTFVDEGDGPVSVPNTGMRSTLSRDQRDAILSLKPSAVSGDPPTRNWRDRLRKQLNGLTGQDAVDLFIVLPDIPFDWAQLQSSTLSDSQRADIVSARTENVDYVLQPVLQKLDGIAIEPASTFWVIPGIRAVVPLDRVEQILEWTEPEEIVRNGPYEVGPSAYYSGYETRAGLRASDFLNYGYTGNTGGQSSGRVRVGIYDSNVLASGHPGFKRWHLFGWISRFQAIWNCEHSACSSYSPPQGTSHGSAVTSVAVGSIEAGQDPSISDPTERVKHSGISSGADIYYYTSVGSPGYVDTNIAVAQRAIEDGIDVFNRSGWWGICTNCDAQCTGGGYTATMRNMANAGILYVTAIGNSGDPGGCTADYPATVRHGLAIGALGSHNDTSAYDDLSVASFTARGGMDIYSNGAWRYNALAIADLVAPGCIRNLNNFTGTWIGIYGYDTTGLCGTSLAAPVVTGSVALVKDALYQSGYAVNDVDILLAHMLLMGDGYKSDSGQIMNLGVDQRSGAGRVHLWYPSSQNLTPPAGWGCHKFAITHNQTVSFWVGPPGPESTSITQWKAALTFNEPDLMNAADIDLQVWNTCPEGGGEVLIMADLSTDIRSRIRLLGHQIGDRCLQYRVHGWYVPQGQSRTVSVCDYYHSGDPNDH